MKVNHDLNRIMKRAPRGHNIREEQEAGAVVAAGIVICTLILIVAIFIDLACR